MNEFLDQIYYNNTVRDYLIAIGVILGGIIVVQAFKKLIIKRLEAWAGKTSGAWDNFIVNSIGRFGLPIARWIIVYWAVHLLKISARTERFIEIATSLVVTYYVLRLISAVVVVLLKSMIRQRNQGEEMIKQLGGLIMTINIIVWFLGFVFLLSNWGIEVTPLIAGLGIGGIAVALAAQNILGDLFNYFVIFFDRPFQAGDFIIVDDKLGTIEYVGIKTTHIRSLGGEQIIIGNSNLTNSRIHNYKRMIQRRVVFTIDVEYGTPLETLEKIPGILRSIVESKQSARFDRAHFAAYKEWSLRFEVVYYALSADYNIYMDIQQKINLEIYKVFQENNVRFAIPAQSMFIKNEAGAATPS